MLKNLKDDSYSYMLEGDDCDIADVNGDGIADLIVKENNYATTVYTYNSATDSVVELESVVLGKHHFPAYYNTAKRQVLFHHADTGGRDYQIFEFIGNKSVLVSTLRIDNGKHKESGDAEAFLNGEQISVEEFNRIEESIYDGFTAADPTITETIEKIVQNFS